MNQMAGRKRPIISWGTALVLAGIAFVWGLFAFLIVALLVNLKWQFAEPKHYALFGFLIILLVVIPLQVRRCLRNM
jgi:hypothetical protein